LQLMNIKTLAKSNQHTMRRVMKVACHPGQSGVE
jgi:hypothetical protein